MSISTSFTSLDSQANAIATAVYDVIKEGKVRTGDMSGSSISLLDRVSSTFLDCNGYVT